MVDLRKFLPVYFEESEEKLALLEAGLRTLALGRDDGILEQTARAAHSIKGASGTFGFDDVCTLAWAIEEALRQVAKGQLLLAPELVAECLEAGGLLRETIRRHREGQEVPVQPLNSVVDRLKTRIAA